MSSTGEGNSGQTIVPMAVVAAEPLVISVGGGEQNVGQLDSPNFHQNTSSSFGSASSPPPTPTTSDLENDDNTKDSDIVDIPLLTYELERQSADDDNFDGITSKKEIIKYLRTTNDKLLSQALVYKRKCETYDRKLNEVRAESSRKITSIKNFYSNVLVGYSRSSTMLRKSLS